MNFYEYIITYFDAAEDDFLRVRGVTFGDSYKEAMEHITYEYEDENITAIHYLGAIEITKVYQFNAEDTKFQLRVEKEPV